MEKIMKYVTYFIGVLILIVVIIYFSQNIKGSYFLTEEDRRFFSLCGQWQAQNNCTADAIPLIDQSQEIWGDPSLTEACIEKFPSESTEKSLIICQDVCKAKCVSKLYYDLAVFDHGITKDNYNINIVIENLGTATAFDVKVKIIGIGEEYEQDRTITIYSQSSNKTKCLINNCGTDIRVEVDYSNEITETNEKNNIAKQKWVY